MIRFLHSIVRLDSCTRNAAALLAGLAMIAATSGCIEGKACTAMACLDGFHITTATADKSWAPGDYALEITVDGEVVSCAYSWTGTSPPGQLVSAQCSSRAVSVEVHPVTTCTETRRGDAVSQSCVPVPGQFTQGISISGTPARVDVTERRDGAVLGERSFTPGYRTWYPNGEGCEPGCRVDEQEWELP
ncbi:hypothetical protein SOCE26_023390 [Sorangium cellulosum]|uniref:Uncharacterized protein n=1 Tax=Sorangium cellulosum TaxID=56 RepID=A0A2L0ENR0_SORCE|nr:hypothetical protein [Sorangium cellulosum]AUX40937.1 hypothetical protein SOCE26_023390 [Sorangium cellulosum]